MRLAMLMCVIAAAAAGIVYIPFPCRVSAPALIEPAGAHRIYVSTPGTLINAVSAGTRVTAGQVLARLEDATLGREIADRRAEYERALTRVRHLEVRATVDAAAAAELLVAREACVDAEQRLNKRLGEERALTLKAPIAGAAIPPPATRHPSVERQLAAWSGTPLEQRNKQCFLERGTLLCLVGDTSRQEAFVYADGADAPYLRVGQRARLQFDVGPAVVRSGRIVEIAQAAVSVLPAELTADNLLASRADDTGQLRPLRPTYLVRVAFDDPPEGGLVVGSRGRAKIEVEPQTLSQRIIRAVRQALTIEI
jgi:putative peptide zinc metalloprotease protein